MYYHPKKKTLVMVPPRTASRTVKEFLCDRLGFVAADNHHSSLGSGVNDRYGGHSQHLIHQIADDGNWHVAAVIRHHYDRIASFWRLAHDVKMPDYTKDEDVEAMGKVINACTRNVQVSVGNPMGFMYLPWTCYATHVLKYENLEHDLFEFLTSAGFKLNSTHKLGHVGKTMATGRNYKLYFDERTKARLWKYVGYEMRLYGYEW